MTDKRRSGTAGDRDILVPKHRASSPAVAFVDEECTGKYEGEELLEMRRARAEEDPAGRIALLETDQKKLAGDVTAIMLSVVEIKGDQKTQNATLAGMAKTLDRLAQLDHLTLTTKLEVDRAQQTAAVQVDTAEKIDAIDARKAKRQLIVKVAGLAGLLGMAAGKLLHWLGVF